MCQYEVGFFVTFLFIFGGGAYYSTQVKVREQPTGACSLLPPCGFQGCSGCQPWQLSICPALKQFFISTCQSLLEPHLIIIFLLCLSQSGLLLESYIRPKCFLPFDEEQDCEQGKEAGILHCHITSHSNLSCKILIVRTDPCAEYFLVLLQSRRLQFLLL